MSAEELRSLWAELPALNDLKRRVVLVSITEARKAQRVSGKELLSGSNTPLVLGDYVLLSKIGAGGMGQVFKASIDTWFGSSHQAATGGDDQRRGDRQTLSARSEGRRQLSHPIYRPRLTMRACNGVSGISSWNTSRAATLSAFVKRAWAVARPRSVDCILQAARGLAYAHSKGVVHRDINQLTCCSTMRGSSKFSTWAWLGSISSGRCRRSSTDEHRCRHGHGRLHVRPSRRPTPTTPTPAAISTVWAARSIDS